MIVCVEGDRRRIDYDKKEGPRSDLFDDPNLAYACGMVFFEKSLEDALKILECSLDPNNYQVGIATGGSHLYINVRTPPGFCPGPAQRVAMLVDTNDTTTTYSYLNAWTWPPERN